ncbi:MAG: hypothetical protein ACRDLP_06070 [Solirubrobacteraceae bacterium]
MGSGAYAAQRLAQGAMDPVASKGKLLPRFKSPADNLLALPFGLLIAGFLGHVLAAVVIVLFVIGGVIFVPVGILLHDRVSTA